MSVTNYLRLQILTDGRIVDHNVRNAQTLEVVGRSYAGKHENLRRNNGPGTKNHFPAGQRDVFLRLQQDPPLKSHSISSIVLVKQDPTGSGV